MKEQMIKIDILGTRYKLYFETHASNPRFQKDNCDGYVITSEKEIHILLLSSDEIWNDSSKKAITATERRVVRHEIVHAFLSESGLEQCSGGVSAWAKNEEMIDWLALQWEKINKAIQKVDKLYN